jgi:hypothetical protein
MTQQGFLRLASNQQVFGTHALTLRGAWQKYDIFQSDPRISYLGEPEHLETHWRAFTQAQTARPKSGTTLTWLPLPCREAWN